MPRTFPTIGYVLRSAPAHFVLTTISYTGLRTHSWQLRCLWGYKTCTNHLSAMSRVAKATLVASIVASVSIIWGVHFLQWRESNVRLIFLSHSSPSPISWLLKIFDHMFYFYRQCFKASSVTMCAEKRKCVKERKISRSQYRKEQFTNVYNMLLLIL